MLDSNTIITYGALRVNRFDNLIQGHQCWILNHHNMTKLGQIDKICVFSWDEWHVKSF